MAVPSSGFFAGIQRFQIQSDFRQSSPKGPEGLRKGLQRKSLKPACGLEELERKARFFGAPAQPG
jgi:hypothetical protein